MARIGFRVIRSPARKRMINRFADARAEVKNALADTVKKEAIRYADAIVGNWDNKPVFVASIYVESDRIEMHLEPTGPGRNEWEWTSKGTKPHLILATKAPFLVFNTDYVPKTTPAPSWGGLGKASGNLIRIRAVNHHGTDPRNFEKWISEQIKGEFRRIIENALRRGIRRAG